VRTPKKLIAPIAVVLAALFLSGCSGSQFGAAAVVDGERITAATMEASVAGLMNQRRAAGEKDTGTIRTGEDARNTMRFHILSVMLRQVGESLGVTISDGERRQVRNQIVASVGGEDGLTIALTQNGIWSGDLATYIDDVLYQRKIGETLVPGTGDEIESQRNDAVQKVMQAKLDQAKISVNPRYGVFDKSTGMLTSRDTTNGVVTLPAG